MQGRKEINLGVYTDEVNRPKVVGKTNSPSKTPSANPREDPEGKK
jgi:hypothetical protein